MKNKSDLISKINKSESSFTLSSLRTLADEKSRKNGTYVVEDGEHIGTITVCKYDFRKGRVYLDIFIENEKTLFKTSIDAADFGREPLIALIDAVFEEDDTIIWGDLEGIELKFSTQTNTSKDDNKFSNIVDLELIYDDEN